MPKIPNQELLIAPFVLKTVLNGKVPSKVTRAEVLEIAGDVPAPFKQESFDLSLFDDAEHNFPSVGGSENIPWLKNAVRLFDPKREERALSELYWVYQQSINRRWMQNEPYSRIYSTWHLIGCLIAYYWSHIVEANNQSIQWLRDFTEGWLLNFWALCWFSHSEVESGALQCTFCGSRSADRDLDPQMHDFAFAIAMGVDHKKYKAYMAKTWEGRVLLKLKDCITASFSKLKPHLGNPNAMLKQIPNWGSVVEINILRTEAGVCSWIGDDEPKTDDDFNGNTGPLAAFKILFDKLIKKITRQSLPANSGIRIRQKPTFVSCWRVAQFGSEQFDPNGKFLCMEHSIEGTHFMELPTGPESYLICHNSDGWTLATPPGSSEPVKPTTPEEKPDIPSERPKKKDKNNGIIIGAIVALIAGISSMFSKKKKEGED